MLTLDFQSLSSLWMFSDKYKLFKRYRFGFSAKTKYIFAQEQGRI
jgi:hypothetical protein